MIDYDQKTGEGTIICDRLSCDCQYDVVGSFDDLIEAAQNAGWHLRNAVHICPTCWDLEETKEHTDV